MYRDLTELTHTMNIVWTTLRSQIRISAFMERVYDTTRNNTDHPKTDRSVNCRIHRVRPGLVSPSTRPLDSTVSDSIRVTYTTPPSPRPHSSLTLTQVIWLLTCPTRSPGLVSPSVRPIGYDVCFTITTQCMRDV
jgi:hypothetical protein